MKKRIKKIISYFLPKGRIKEKIKLHYYNFFSSKEFSFKLTESNSYESNYRNVTIETSEPLYTIAPDFNFYQHFYKVKENDVVLDTGANCGHLSILFSKLVGKDGFVYAFEPDRYNIESIKNNILLNKDLNPNIEIVDLLLWNENIMVNFHEAGTVASSAVWIPDVENCVEKQAILVDDWVKENNIKKLDFIKMDIEGAEIEALDGCIETIRKFKPNFAIASYHVVNGEKTFIKVEQFFKKLSYPFRTIQFKKEEIITFAGPSINN